MKGKKAAHGVDVESESQKINIADLGLQLMYQIQ